MQWEKEFLFVCFFAFCALGAPPPPHSDIYGGWPLGSAAEQAAIRVFAGALAGCRFVVTVFLVVCSSLVVALSI